MKIDKLNLDGKKTSIEVLDKIFLAKINKKLVDTVLYKTNANYKGRHGKTKQQNEVAGATSKIYAQKGTGGARHASRKAPIFVGGGVALVRALQKVEGLKGDNEDQNVGIGLLLKAVTWPLRQIVENAGEEGSVVLDKVKAGEGNFGFNAATGEYGDMLEMGIIDPAKVTRTALQAAGSVAGLMITTEAMVSEKPEEKGAAMPGGGGMPDMGGMGGMM